jgi:lipid A 3-O-deacylase
MAGELPRSGVTLADELIQCPRSLVYQGTSMQPWRPYIILLFFLLPVASFAQAVDNAVAFRNIHSDRYFRINYENDFFTGTDRDYTQGIYIEKVNSNFRKFFLSRLLWRPRNSEVQYGLGVEQDVYTPNHLDVADILYGDRPYAGSLFLKTFLTATDAERRQRVSTSLSTGLIGPDAGGEGMQKAIHHWINYITPLGWHNQIRNDLVLNYQVNYEKEIFSASNALSLSSYSSVRLGTLSSKVTTGLTVMAGNFYSPFKDIEAHPGNTAKKWQWYVYDQPLVNLVGYDATLQGGLFNHSSPYTIPASQIDRLTFQHKFGLVIILKGLYLEYFQTSLTKEFSTSVYHRTGGIQVGFGF